MDEYKRNGYFSEEEEDNISSKSTRGVGSNRRQTYRSGYGGRFSSSQSNQNIQNRGKRDIEDMDKESTQDEDENAVKSRKSVNKSKNYEVKDKIREENEVEVSFG